jgi:hypothetical protein
MSQWKASSISLCSSIGTVGYKCNSYAAMLLFDVQAQRMPNISYQADVGSLWTLLVTNPDGHLTDSKKEYAHCLMWVAFLHQVNSKATFGVNLFDPGCCRWTGKPRLVIICNLRHMNFTIIFIIFIVVICRLHVSYSSILLKLSRVLQHLVSE